MKTYLLFFKVEKSHLKHEGEIKKKYSMTVMFRHLIMPSSDLYIVCLQLNKVLKMWVKNSLGKKWVKKELKVIYLVKIFAWKKNVYIYLCVYICVYIYVYVCMYIYIKRHELKCNFGWSEYIKRKDLKVRWGNMWLVDNR